MSVKNINFKNFKNLNRRIEFSDGVNILVGPNGIGKTNTLEGIYILSSASSFYTYPEINIINHNNNAEFSKVTGDVDGHVVEVIITKTNDGSVKRLKIDDVEKYNGEFSSIFSSILFSPDSVDLVGGAPDIRRKDLDDYLSKLDDNYRKDISMYKKIVRNRNKLLVKMKAGQGSLDELDFWNERLVTLGSGVIVKRVELLDTIKNELLSLATKLFKSELKGLDIVYSSKLELKGDIKSNFNQSIIENLDKEIALGTTLFGPHRDELLFDLNNFSLRIKGSRGQQRLAALIYKLALWENLFNKKGSKPILMLDDIMSELDNQHRKNIEDIISEEKYSQVILTSSDMNDFTKEFIKRSNTIHLEA